MESVITFLDYYLKSNIKIFPNGFYWLIKDGNEITEKLANIIDRFKSSAIEADFVKINNFDDCLISIYNQLNTIDKDIESLISKSRSPQPFYVPSSNKDNYIVLNFFEINKFPKTFHTFKYKNISNWDILDKKTNNTGVVASFFREKMIITLGEKNAILDTFNENMENDLDIYTILEKDLFRLNKNNGFIYTIFYKIFDWHFENNSSLVKRGDRIFYNDVVNEKQINKYGKTVKFYKAFKYSLEFRDNKLLFILIPYYITYDFRQLNPDYYKIKQNFLISNIYNVDVFQDLLFWRKFLINDIDKKIKISFFSEVLF